MLLCCYMLVDFARGPSQTPIIQGLEFFNRLKYMLNMDTVAELPGLSSPCTMKYGESLLTAFSLGCTPPIQRKTGTDLLARPHPIDTLLHLAIAPIAPLHRMRGGGQQLSVETRAGLVQRGGKELLQCLPHLWAPLEPTPQFGQCVQSGLGPPASIA
jgi:hypothetical protein